MLQQILTELAKNKVTLVAVSKTKPESAILDMYNQGHRIFGENKVQELVAKQGNLPKDIEWHFIGHLQRNKVKYIASFVHLIHSIDSPKLLKEVNKQAKKSERVVDVLLQLKIAEETSKFGFDSNTIKQFLSTDDFKMLTNIRVVGLMGMATFTYNDQQVRNEFKLLKKTFDDLKTTYFSDKDYFNELSMGMSGDYKMAIEEGSTMVRIGSLLFGNRNYV